MVSTTRVFPPNARADRPLGTDIRTGVRPAVEGDDAGFMHHFLHDRDIARRLHDLLSVAIDHRVYGANTPRLMQRM